MAAGAALVADAPGCAVEAHRDNPSRAGGCAAGQPQALERVKLTLDQVRHRLDLCAHNLGDALFRSLQNGSPGRDARGRRLS